MGFVITNFAGGRLLSHGGGGRGWRHMIALLPERQLGVTLMVAAESPLVDGIALDLLDRMAGLPSRRWAERFAEHAIRIAHRSEEHTSELQSLMRISYAGFCLKKKKTTTPRTNTRIHNT